MVYLHFPSNLTEEELMLQAKYGKLKKKKKALQALKAPKQEPEKPLPAKRGTEARDAREIARKLLKSGAIQAIKSPPPLPQNATFKRPRAGRERKLSGGGGAVGAGGGVASYQPFSASQEPPPDEKASPRVKYLYDSFVTARDNAGRQEKATVGAGAAPGAAGVAGTAAAAGSAAEAAGEREPKRGGNTLLVTAARLTEEALRRRVAPHAPVDFRFDAENNKALVTLQSPELAARVLGELHGTPAEEGGAALRVQYARRPRGDGAAWGAPAAPPPRPPRDPARSVVTYDDIFE